MMTGRLHAQRGAAGSSREQRGAAGSSGEQRGAAGSSGEQRGAAGRSREQQGAAGLLLHSEASSLMSRLQLPQRNRSVPCTVSPASVAQFMLERQRDR